MQPLVEEYRISNVKEDTLIYEDNIPAINLANNEQTKGRTKHLSIKLKLICQHVKLGQMSGSLESNRTNSEQYIRGRHTTPNISENNFANNSEEDDM